jgi:molybdopterin converting factor small subunit
MAQLIIPTPLRKFTDGKGQFESQKSTVDEVIFDLVGQYDSLKNQLLDEDGKLRSFVRVYVGDEDIQSLNNGATQVKEDTVISIIPAIAGGLK